jgi:hypothetical protein
VKYSGSIGELPSKLPGLSVTEEYGILGVRVKSVDIEKNTSGEGDILGHY